MIATIHQPEHLPWLGFFAKMSQAELFVSLDTVPFRKNYFQNRNRVLGHDGEPMWLTVPVRLDGHLDGAIQDVSIAGDGRWRKKYLRSLRQRYGKHPFFEEAFPAVEAAVRRDHGRLVDLNHELIGALRDLLGIATPWVRASETGVQGSSSELLAGLCEAVGADTYLSGPSGRDYLELEPFRERGIEVRVHDYEHPGYPQRGADTFVSHLSSVDLLFNRGAESGEALRGGSRVTPFEEAVPDARAGATTA